MKNNRFTAWTWWLHYEVNFILKINLRVLLPYVQANFRNENKKKIIIIPSSTFPYLLLLLSSFHSHFHPHFSPSPRVLFPIFENSLDFPLESIRSIWINYFRVHHLQRGVLHIHNASEKRERLQTRLGGGSEG